MVRTPCCDKEKTKKGVWTKKEDTLLINYVNEHGEGNWRNVPKAAGLLRCGKSCRLRWMNYLQPGLKRGNFTEQEDNKIILLHQMFGNKWASMARMLNGRTDNEIKNHWNTHLKHKLYNQGIDPQNHRPLIKGDPETEKHEVDLNLTIGSPYEKGEKQKVMFQQKKGKSNTNIQSLCICINLGLQNVCCLCKAMSSSVAILTNNETKHHIKSNIDLI